MKTIWYDRAFTANDRSEVFGEMTVEQVQRYHAGVEEMASQPTTYAEALEQANQDAYYEEQRDKQIEHETDAILMERQGDLEDMQKDYELEK